MGTAFGDIKRNIETDLFEVVSNLGHVDLVLSVGAVLVLDLYHQDVATVAHKKRLGLLGDFTKVALGKAHELGFVASDFEALFVEKPVGVPTELPFRAHVGSWTEDDVHPLLLADLCELSDILIALEVEMPLFRLVHVPEDVLRDGVQTHRLRHPDALSPIFLRDARRVNFTREDQEWFAIDNELTVCDLKGVGGSRRRIGRDDQRAEREGGQK